MKEVSIHISYQVYEEPSELAESDEKLLRSAVGVLSNAYAPYSAFNVGAAVLLENGEVVCGTNQENVAYPSGICAERVALFYAAAKYPDVAVKAIAITASTTEFEIHDPVTPCGSCRQVMAETEVRYGKSMHIVMRGETGRIFVTEGVNNLLPLMFHADKLKK